MKKYTRFLLVFAGLLLMPLTPVFADSFSFLGQTVTGTLSLNGFSGNFWDVSNGGTGAGPLVLALGQDFASSSGFAGTIFASFTSSGVTIGETCNPTVAAGEGLTCDGTTGSWNGWTATIAGLTGLGGLLAGSDTFPSGISFTDTPTSITFTYAGGDHLASYSATFGAVGAAEPSSLELLFSFGLAALGLGFLRRLVMA